MSYRNFLPIGVLLIAFAAVHVDAQNPRETSVPTIDFCALVKNPRTYANQRIRVKAILLENQTPRVDGGDPILYDPRCPDSDFSVTVTFADTFKTNAAYEALQRIRSKPDESDNTRAVVTLVGQFQYSGKPEYGHLDWANSQVLIYEIESASSLESSSKP